MQDDVIGRFWKYSVQWPCRSLLVDQGAAVDTPIGPARGPKWGSIPVVYGFDNRMRRRRSPRSPRKRVCCRLLCLCHHIKAISIGTIGCCYHGRTIIPCAVEGEKMLS